jgi:hypothetical protein
VLVTVNVSNVIRCVDGRVKGNRSTRTSKQTEADALSIEQKGEKCRPRPANKTGLARQFYSLRNRSTHAH